jgi:hypothetical protein
MYSLFKSRAILIPCHAVTRCGRDSSQDAKLRVLWQYIDSFTEAKNVFIANNNNGKYEETIDNFYIFIGK